MRLFAKPFRDYRSRMDLCAWQEETSLNPLTRQFYILLRVFCTRVRAAASKLPREKVHPSRTKSARAFIVHPRQLPMRYVPFFIRHRHAHTGAEGGSRRGETDETDKRTLQTRETVSKRRAALYQTNGPDVIF